MASLAMSLLQPQAAQPGVVRAPQPVLFYQLPGKLEGGSGAELDDVATRAKVHDRMLPALAKILGTQVINVDLGDPSPAKLAAACREHGAVGALAVGDAWQDDPSERVVAIVTLTLRNCSATDWFGVSGQSVQQSGKEGLFSRMMDDVIGQALAQLTQIVNDTPNAASNFVRYGFYMGDTETDSFWTLEVRGGKTFVNTSDPVGTAWRAGLREDDEVLAVDETPTVGIDTAALNAILENAKRGGAWKLTIRTRNGPSRVLTFENEDVAWYVQHPPGP
ncbi:MAG: hypothetical protein ABI202_07980 [Candidatus Baltobacteraceae bacterium]